MIRNLASMARSKSWWYFLMVLGVAMIGIALYYQHVLNEWPCVLCIQVRILFLFLVVTAVLALILFRFRKIRMLMHFVVAVISAVMINRSWILLATERGWLEGECSVNLGMPAWFAIDKWLPDIFSAWTSCGYTPVMAFGITMAEILILISALLLMSGVALFAAAFREQP
jgi:protein dithiol:quinone oxidoreductase